MHIGSYSAVSHTNSDYSSLRADLCHPVPIIEHINLKRINHSPVVVFNYDTGKEFGMQKLVPSSRTTPLTNIVAGSEDVPKRPPSVCRCNMMAARICLRNTYCCEKTSW